MSIEGFQLAIVLSYMISDYEMAWSLLLVDSRLIMGWQVVGDAER